MGALFVLVRWVLRGFAGQASSRAQSEVDTVVGRMRPRHPDWFAALAAHGR
jgi:hypothetical protein